MTSRFIARDVACGSATGRIYDYGAQVTAWQPRSEAPVIWQPASAPLTEGKPIRGGIPVCFPWFGAGDTGERQPFHGPARRVRWLLMDSFLDEANQTHQLTYRLTPRRLEDPVGWEFEALLSATFGKQLEVSLSVTNTDTEPVVFEEALHTYVAVGDASRVEVLGLDDDDFIDFTGEEPTRGTQSLELAFDGNEVNRLFSSTAPVTVEDPNNARRIVVRKSGSANTLVWNPGAEGSRTRAGLADGDWKKFLCIVSANCKDDAVSLEPGQTHVLTQTLSVEHL
ncbi:D-hexose-6-phosphate mutarotase [Nanchangia anserum]|uniref:Putative glucose-6-phosphate 1-epimerase n=1 Tax=Nanchangia anserum TaxID=2692125 RepID=A0A8I0GHM4_9ACTO|nr:D-hexose-6-phosphate mutarotase [Nanchangia anserum]MBD3690139.1 D-hexose-6-phosphate mutarotase [Nanchangia anserum]QOX82081.1 D-hexose-6-phosphate mutarotase [Nanchangia anserum]